MCAARADATGAIMRAAEQMFAERGLDGVSLREITRAVGARNTSATQYHFGDRKGLLRAIVDRHSLRRSAPA